MKAVAACLVVAVLVAIVLDEQLYRARYAESLLSGDVDVVLAEMSRLDGERFCLQLTDQRDGALMAAAQRDVLLGLYNTYARGHGLETEWETNRSPVSAVDLNGLIFQAHINPWQDCWERYRITALY